MSFSNASSTALPQVALATMLFFVPRAVHACAVCFGGQEGDTRMAFILTTAFLTFMPLLSIGGFVWWLRRRFRQLAREESAVAPIDSRAA